MNGEAAAEAARDVSTTTTDPETAETTVRRGEHYLLAARFLSTRKKIWSRGIAVYSAVKCSFAYLTS